MSLAQLILRKAIVDIPIMLVITKNCYLIFDSDFNEDCQYGEVIKHSKSCLDSSYLKSCELMYGCLDCHSCYNLKYSQDCTNSFDSFF